MPTVIYADGFEHRSVSADDFLQADGTALFDSLFAPAQITNVAGRNGGRALQVSPAGALARADKLVPGTDPTVAVVSFYLKFTVLPTDNWDVFTLDAGAGENGRLWWNNSTGKLNIAFSQTAPSGNGDVGPVIATDTWYRIDMRCDVSTGTRTLDCQVDGSAATQQTQVIAASTIIAWRFGFDAPTAGTPTYTAQYDDFVASNTSGDYPLGAHRVLPLFPNGDGTHVISGAGDIDRFDGTDILVSTTTAWQEVDDWITGATDTTTGILVLAAASTEYTEHTFDDTTEATIWAVIGVAAAYPSSTTAHLLTVRLVNSGGTTVAEMLPTANFDISVATNVLEYSSRLMSQNPTQATVNGYKVRIGLSTDVAPDPKFTAVMLQIAVPGEGVTTSLPFKRKDGLYLPMRDHDPWNAKGGWQ